MLVESTYGGREHEPSDEAIRILAETIRMVAEAGGVLLVPSFAIGRTQEVVWQLDRLIERGEIPLLPLYLDSPMASKASDIYRRHPENYDEETAKLLREGASPLDYPNQIVTNDASDSKAIARAERPYLIVASNGMLTGGRVVSHLRNLIDDPAATILFVGYQGEGTLGAHLQAGAREVKLDGQVRRVRCQVRSISGFSAHADEHELLDWLGRFARRQAPGRPGLPPAGLPGPRRPGGPGRPRAKGPGARLRDPRPALARTGDPGLSRWCRSAPPNRRRTIAFRPGLLVRYLWPHSGGIRGLMLGDGAFPSTGHHSFPRVLAHRRSDAHDGTARRIRRNVEGIGIPMPDHRATVGTKECGCVPA